MYIEIEFIFSCLNKSHKNCLCSICATSPTPYLSDCRTSDDFGTLHQSPQFSADFTSVHVSSQGIRKAVNKHFETTSQLLLLTSALFFTVFVLHLSHLHLSVVFQYDSPRLR